MARQRRFALVAAVGGLLVALFFGAAAQSSHAAAHAGAILVTNSGPFGAHSKLYLVRDGSPARLFLDNAGQAAISRDGKRIAFVRDGGIWTMGRDSSGERQLTKPTQ